MRVFFFSFFNFVISKVWQLLCKISANISEIYSRVNICPKNSEFLGDNFDLMYEKTTPCLFVHVVFLLFFSFFWF